MSRDDPYPISMATKWPWPPLLDGELVARFRAGERVKAIAAGMGRPTTVVQGRLNRLREHGLVDYRGRPWTGPETARLFDALEAGAGYSQLAPLFRRTRAALREHALKVRRERAAAEAAGERDQLRMEFGAE